MGNLATLDADAAIDMLASGSMLKDIAAQHGVSKQAVHRKLSSHPRYKQAIKDQASALVHKAMEEVQAVCLPQSEEDRKSVDAVDIARVRELRASAFRYAESVSPEQWGQKTHVTGDLSITVVISDGLEALQHDVSDADIISESGPNPLITE